MKSIRKIGLGYFLLLTGWSVNLFGQAQEEFRQQAMLGDLEVIKHVLQIEYAPSAWKKKYLGWDLENAFQESKSLLTNKPNVNLKDFQQIVRAFLSTTRDYHVNVFFLSTEFSSLPFTVKGVDGRYFIDWIDARRLSPSVYAIGVGDEIVKFDGRPIQEVMSELKQQAGKGANENTDQSLAEISLTYRSGERGDVVSKGSINIGIKSATNGQRYSYQLMWNYYPEYIRSPYELPWLNHALSALPNQTYQNTFEHKKAFFNPVDRLFNCPLKTARGIGGHQSYIPPLGEIQWVGEDSAFYAYIYQHESGKNIGYIRIPHYKNAGADLEQFGETISFFEENTDGLIIDQVDNPGGYVESQYILASMLTSYPLTTPKHRLMITQRDVMEAFDILSILEHIHSDEEAEALFLGSNLYKTHQYVLFLKEFYRFIIDEWNAGRMLTNPIHIEGVDQINPHPQHRYTKPILIVINQLDFSGGDFFPAIMQDNKRATLFGTRTAGAGGFVRGFGFPNCHGIAGFTYTASIAERPNKQPIENLGVSPDVECPLTVEDLQYQYQPYIKQINRTIQQLLD